MTSFPAAWVLRVTSVALVCFSATGCGQKQEPPAVTPAKSASPPIRVAVVKPQRKSIQRSITQPGQIEAFEQARLYAKVPAYVETYTCDIGDKVEYGQQLATLSAPELVRELEQKRALVTQAGAELEQAQAAIKVVEADAVSADAAVRESLAAVKRHEAEAEKWNSEYDRVVRLVSRSAVTQKLADETKAQLQSARAAQEQAEATIERAKSELAASQAHVAKARADELTSRARRDVAEADLARAAAVADYLSIKAPFEGTISERNADVGVFAQPPTSSDARPLFTLVRTDRVRVFIDVPETDAPLVDPDDHAGIFVQALAGQEFSGSVARTSWTLDPSTRTLRVEVDVANPQGVLRPGMYAQVSLQLASRTNALVVPAAAVVTQKNRPIVVALVDGKARHTNVVLGIRGNDEVEIVSGLKGDETLILAKGASIADGQAVEVP